MFISPEKRRFYFLLPHNIRQEGHEARAFDRFGQGALVASGQVGAAARHYFAVRIEKLFYGLGVLVVDADKLWCVKIFHNDFVRAKRDYKILPAQFFI